MSRLYHTEEGRVIPSLCEELTRFRRARKILDLPATAAPAEVFLLARPYPGHTGPLRLSVNGREAAAVEPSRPGVYQWYRVEVEAEALRERLPAGARRKARPWPGPGSCRRGWRPPGSTPAPPGPTSTDPGTRRPLSPGGRSGRGTTASGRS